MMNGNGKNEIELASFHKIRETVAQESFTTCASYVKRCCYECHRNFFTYSLN